MAADIRRILTAQQVAEFYGFQVGRSGFMKCPFHQGDHTASLKLYDGDGGWHCFGCGAHGSVIDFAMLLFNCSFREAMGRLDSDFHLGIGISKPITYRERKGRQKAIMAIREHDRQLAEINAKCNELERRYDMADELIRNLQPSDPDELTCAFAWALKSIDAIKYDLLLAEGKRWELEQSPRNPGLDTGDISNTRTV
jgi:hypothetical protein